MTTVTGVVRVYDYAAWYADTKSTGGVVTVWPFKSGMYAQYYGKPAARYSAQGYTHQVNAGAVSISTPTQTDATSQYVWVLAPQSAWAGAPQTASGFQSFLNSAFTAGDRTADAIGLPSLASVESFLKSLGRDGLLIGGVIGLAWYLLHRKQ